MRYAVFKKLLPRKTWPFDGAGYHIQTFGTYVEALEAKGKVKKIPKDIEGNPEKIISLFI